MPTSLYFLLWGALISCLVFFATEREFLEALRRRWLPLGLILCMAIVWRLPFERAFFLRLWSTKTLTSIRWRHGR